MNQVLFKLKDIAQISPGLSIKVAINDDPEGTHQVIMGKHLTPGEPYIFSPEQSLKIIPGRSVEKYQLKQNDILFMSRGLSNFPVILKTIPQPAITPSSFNVIRVHDGINPNYVTWAMNQDVFQSQLKDIRTGSGTLMVSRANLAELSIPVPPLETQIKIVRVGELMRRERNIRRELLEETERLQLALGRKILNSFTDSK